MHSILLLILAFVATSLGALTGMGGGLLIKPILDASAQFDADMVNLLSTISVLTMASVTVGKRTLARARTDEPRPVAAAVVVPLAIGAVLGGWIGGLWISRLIAADEQSSLVLQNTMLAGLVILILIYMHRKEKLRRFSLSGILPSFTVGLFSGTLASFLGIGGGPFNVAAMILLFSYTTKQAAFASLVIILFSQSAKTLELIWVGSFADWEARLIIPMVIGAILGGSIGSILQRRMSEQMVEHAFRGMQYVVLALCLWNIANGV